MSKQVLQQLPDGVFTFEDWQYTQAIILRNGELSVYVGGTEAARLKLGDMRLCKLVEQDDAASVPSDEVQAAGVGADVVDGALKSCPFCGDSVKIENEGNNWYVWCDTCDLAIEGFVSESHAKSRWNRRAEQPALAVSAPQPDWANAPTWAMWWAVDADGGSNWFEHEPKPMLQRPYAVWGMGRTHAISQSSRRVELQLGVDWRATLCKRPAGGQEVT